MTQLNATTRSLLAAGLCFSLAFAGETLADDDILAVAWGGDVYAIDSVSGQGHLLRHDNEWTEMNCLARAYDGHFYSEQNGTILRVNPSSGFIRFWTVLHGIEHLTAFAASPLDGNLYGVQRYSPLPRLLRFDPRTGFTTYYMGQTSHTGIQAMAIDSTGNAYAWDVREGLLSIDLQTGATTDINNNVGGTGDIQTLCFDSEDRLYGGRDALYRISTTTGEYVEIGSGGYTDIRGMVFTWDALPPYSLDLLGECPGTLTVRWNNAQAQSPQALVFGTSLGVTRIPANSPCAGTVLFVSGNTMVVTPPGIFSTGRGSGEISGRVSAGACGRFLQLVQGSNCEVSNVEQIP